VTGVELETTLRSRRSVRRYRAEAVPLDLLAKVVEAGRLAPTAANLQAWEFIVVTDPKTVARLESLAPGISGRVPALIAVCIDRKRSRCKAGAGGELFGLMDACFAAQNLLLQAHDSGLGACVVRSFHQAGVGACLGCPEHIVPELLVTLGFPEGRLPRGPVRRPLRDVMHLERWNRRASGDDAEEDRLERGPGVGEGAGEAEQAEDEARGRDGGRPESAATPPSGLRSLLLPNRRSTARTG